MSTEKIITIENEDNSKKRIFGFRQTGVIFFAEFFGTGALLFVGCMGVCTQRFTPSMLVLPHLGGVGFGLAVLLCIQLIGHISGGHLNPQVTLAALITGNIPFAMFPVYLIAEFSGAIAGFGLLVLLWPVDSHPECSTFVHPDVTVIQAFGMETFITCLLVMACCAAWDRRQKHNSDSLAIRLGLVVSIISMGAGSITGSSMNSARTLAPALLGNNWENHWVYWAGPTLGSLIGSLLYRFVLGYQSSED